MEKEKAEQYNSETKDGLNKENEDTQSSTKDDAIDNKKTPEDKITDLEEKLVRQYAEMENQRRRYEKEKEDA